jgi:hypothetical protein
MDYRTEMGYRTFPPHDYFTQDLANGKVRLFALETVVNDEVDNDEYDNLRAVATLDWDYGQDLCVDLKDVMFEIDREAERLEGRPISRPGEQGKAARQWAEARARAVQQLTASEAGWPVLEGVISFCRPPEVPNAVATAVFADLARQGIDVTAVAATPSSTSAADLADE